jgi:hypothetical protein
LGTKEIHVTTGTRFATLATIYCTVED